MKPPRTPADTSPTADAPKVPSPPPALHELVRRHLAFGWITLLTFIVLGLVLEALHGLKVGAYLNPSNSTRRLMWTLAHAHGTLLGLVHLGFAATLHLVSPRDSRRTILPSIGLQAATVLIPGGFFLGGAATYGADPGLGIFLVPVGALALIASAGATVALVRSENLDPQSRRATNKRGDLR